MSDTQPIGEWWLTNEAAALLGNLDPNGAWTPATMGFPKVYALMDLRAAEADGYVEERHQPLAWRLTPKGQELRRLLRP